MTIRERLEQEEREFLSEFASHSADSKGRDFKEEECDIRPVYQRDRDRILHSKSFRRLRIRHRYFSPLRETITGRDLPIRLKYPKMRER